MKTLIQRCRESGTNYDTARKRRASGWSEGELFVPARPNNHRENRSRPKPDKRPTGAGFSWGRRYEGGVVTTTKQCFGPCAQILPAESFYPRKQRGCGLSSWCKVCERARQRSNVKARYAAAVKSRGDHSIEESLTAKDVAHLADRLICDALPIPEAGCAIWPYGWTAKGYGRISLPGPRLVIAHRAAWIVAHGAIPSGLMVCHKCDTPACVNALHLFLGTALDNSHDMLRKGRQVSVLGERCVRARLTERQVAEIRSLNVAGVGYRRLAQQFGVARSTISAVCRRQTWKHAEGAA